MLITPHIIRKRSTKLQHRFFVFDDSFRCFDIFIFSFVGKTEAQRKQETISAGASVTMCTYLHFYLSQHKKTNIVFKSSLRC